MKGFIPDHKEEIRKRVDIVELVSEYVTLKKAGRNYLGLCPFHKEKTPSFNVSREKEMFYCYGCGEGGDVFTFLMKMSNMNFPEALRHLARKAGIVIPDRAMNAREREQYGVRGEINRINEIASGIFIRSLSSPAGTKAKEYLKKRGIKDDVVKEFRLGYAPEAWGTLTNYFDKEQISLATVEQAGLIVAKKEATDKGDYYDRFRGRLIFPIEDVSGRVIAFGGRIIGEGEPKYLNSPESPVFSKGRNLYGLNKSKEFIRQKGHAILVEGYFDMVSLWNAGITNIVATMGTALTKEQVELLRRYTENVSVLFDPDEAGKKALERSLPLFLAGGLQAKAIVLPDRYDPDDYVRKFGKERMEETIAGAPPMVDYYIEHILGERLTLEDKRSAIKEYLAFIANLDGAIERNLFTKRISERLGIDEEVLKREANRSLGKSASVPIQEKAGSEFDKVEISLIVYMLEHLEGCARVKETKVLDYFQCDELKVIGRNLLTSFDTKSEENRAASFFLDCLDNGPLKEHIRKSLLETKEVDDGIKNRYISDTIGQIKRKWLKKKSKDLDMEIMKAQEKGDDDLCRSLLRDKIRLMEEEKLL